MIRQDLPPEARNLVGNVFVMAEVGEKWEPLLGPLLTAAEAETLMPAVIALQTVLTPKRIGRVGLTQINDQPGTVGSLNPYFALRPDGIEVSGEEFGEAISTLQATHGPAEPEANWHEDLGPLSDYIRQRFSELIDRYGNLSFEDLLMAVADTSTAGQDESAFEFLELLIAEGMPVPAKVTQAIFQAGLARRYFVKVVAESA